MEQKKERSLAQSAYDIEEIGYNINDAVNLLKVLDTLFEIESVKKDGYVMAFRTVLWSAQDKLKDLQKELGGNVEFLLGVSHALKHT